MKRESFDELFDRSAGGSGFEAEADVAHTDVPGAPDLVSGVLSRVDRHRAFLKPSQARRVVIGRWLISGVAMLGLVAGVLVYDAVLSRGSQDGESQVAGFVPVSGEVRRVNTMLRERISGLLEERDEAGVDPEIARRLSEARSARAPGTASANAAVLLVVPGTDHGDPGNGFGDEVENGSGLWRVRGGTEWRDPNNP